MDHSDDPLLAPILARLDALNETLEGRLDAFDARLRNLERETGEIISLLISIKASLDCTVEDLVEAVAEEEDDDEDDESETVWHFIH